MHTETTMSKVNMEKKMDENIKAEFEDLPPTGNLIELQDPALLKSFKRRCDFVLLPVLSFVYLLNSLDRSNLANAKTDNLTKDLNMVGNQYNLILTFYYVPFVLFGPVGSVVCRKITAKYGIAGMMMGFGIASTCTAVVKSFSGLFACRFFVGVFEAGFLASVVVYLSGFYTRREIASRIGIFYAANVIAAAFGGLLAFGIFHLKDTKLYSWAYLFLLEGSLTILAAIIAAIVLPKDLQRAYFLTQAQRNLGMARQLADSVDETNVPFKWSDAVREFKYWHIYLRIAIIFSYGVLIGTSSNFLPIIVQGMGYSTVKTNLYTVAPSITAAVILIGICFSSDYFSERGFHMVGILTISVIGYILLMTVNIETQRGVAYFAVFLTTIGAFPMSVIFSVWTVSNITNMSSRALAMGVLIAMGNAAGLVSSNIFFADQAPRYITALIINCAMAGVSMVLCLGYTVWMRYENRRRDRVYGKLTNYITAHIVDVNDRNFRFQP